MKIDIELIKKNAWEKWLKDNNGIEVSRVKLESYFDCKQTRKKKIIALLRKKRDITLHLKKYFISNIEVSI